ncbi:STAS domain-containing protein [Luedemannella helvata]|uniref:STAS domain-containing protein n=1 Tax=Luedemannella helvata TaxID=349315 RepID=A0ABP4VZ30_9ACTN
MTSDETRTRLPSFTITVTGPPHHALVALTGEVDMLTVPELGMTLHKLLADERLHRLDLDLSELTFLDASGISTIVGAHQAAVRTGCRLRLLRPRPHIRHVLHLTGVTGLCEVT